MCQISRWVFTRPPRATPQVGPAPPLSISTCGAQGHSLDELPHETPSRRSSLVVLLCPKAKAVSVNVSPNNGIRALGGLEIDGVLYDVAFDGSFGQTIFLGNEALALEAAQKIADVFNSYLSSPHFPAALPTIDNGAGGGPNGTGVYFEITFEGLPGGGGDYIRGQYMAGWGVWNPAEPSLAHGNEVEALFRLHVPGDVIHQLPEPSVAMFGGLGLLVSVRRRRQDISANAAIS